LNNEKESRTGISKNSRGLDADVLKQSTMGAYRDAISQANERIELIIRVIAETGFKEMFRKIHEVLRRHGQPIDMKSNGQWVQVNPREWKERKQIRAQVGLGFNNRQEKLGAAMAIAQHQEKLVMAQSPIVQPQNLYAGAELIAEAAGEKVDRFFTNPAQIPPKPQQQQPDPNMLMIQANKEIEANKTQVQAMKNQSDAQLKQGDLQLKERELMLKEKELSIKEFEAINKSRAESEKLSFEQYKSQINTDSSSIEVARIAAEAEIEKARIMAQSDVVTAEKEAEKAAYEAETKTKNIEFVYDDDGEPVGATVTYQ
jgi:hypothetical protein